MGDLKISMSTEKDLDLKHLSFLIENTSDKEYQYSPDYFEIEAEQSGTWYQLKQLDDPSKSNEKKYSKAFKLRLLKKHNETGISY